MRFKLVLEQSCYKVLYEENVHYNRDSENAKMFWGQLQMTDNFAPDIFNKQSLDFNQNLFFFAKYFPIETQLKVIPIFFFSQK